MQSSIFSTAERPFRIARDKARYSQLIRVCAAEGKLSWQERIYCNVDDKALLGNDPASEE
jgi:hypothetical protein